MKELKTKVSEMVMSKKQMFSKMSGLILAGIFIILVSLLRPKAFLILAIINFIVNVVFCIVFVIKHRGNIELNGLDALRINAIWKIMSSLIVVLMGAMLIWDKMLAQDYIIATVIIAFFYVIWLVISYVCNINALINKKDTQILFINKLEFVWYGVLSLVLIYTFAKTSLGIITVIVISVCMSGVVKLTLMGLMELSIYYYFKTMIKI